MFKKNHRHLQIPLTSHVDELPACACGTVQAKIHAPTTTKESVA
jgi:hypothetical protein